MQVETFLTKGINFPPDFVILSFVENDISLPNFIIKKEPPFSLKKSILIYYLAEKLNLLANYNSKLVFLQSFPNDSYNLELVPEDYRFMFGRESFVRELKKLKKKCDELDIPLILFINKLSTQSHPIDDFAIQTAKEMEIPVVGCSQEAKTFLSEIGKSPEYLQLSQTDFHANRNGNLIKGKVLASFIESFFENGKLGVPASR